MLRDADYKFLKFEIVEQYAFKRKWTTRVEGWKQKMQEDS